MVLTTAIAVASCGGTGGQAAPTPASATRTEGTGLTVRTCQPTVPVPPNNELHTIAFEGRERSYVLSVPGGYDGTSPAPVIFDFYGREGDAQEKVADFELDERATAAGMLVVTPQAAAGRDPSKNAWATDVALVPALLQSLRERWCIDEDAVFAAGFSDGGVFSAYLACELPGVFAAVGTVAEVGFPPDCKSGGPAFSVVGFHGKSDPLVPFDGGATDEGDGRSGLPGSPAELSPSEAVEQTFSEFAGLNGCRRDPAVRPVTVEVDQLVYEGCRPGRAVELYVIADGVHEWPGDPGAEAPPPGSIDANQLMVQFFADHPRR